MLLPQVVSDCRSFILLNSLVKLSARVAEIACIAQATLKMIHSALLIYKGWLVFPHFYFILDFPTCVHRAEIHIDLPTEVSKLSAHCVCRFLIFERQPTILIGASCFSGTCCWVRESSDTFESMNWQMEEIRSLSG